MIEMKDISKIYIMKGSKKAPAIKVEALKDVTIQIQEGELVSIMGPSGSGKSTLLSIMGCLDTPSSGKYILDNKDISTLNDDELSLIRNEKIGFVFQAFHLLPRFNSLENVELPLIYKGIPKERRRQIAKACLEDVGLSHRLSHLPSELSGGEQQRVAIARALSCQPKLILADEPTGNLDSKSAKEIIEILLSLNEKRNITIVIVTHNQLVADKTKRICYLKDGCLYEKN